jgi:hypothetical protein
MYYIRHEKINRFILSKIIMIVPANLKVGDFVFVEKYGAADYKKIGIVHNISKKQVILYIEDDEEYKTIRHNSLYDFKKIHTGPIRINTHLINTKAINIIR